MSGLRPPSRIAQPAATRNLYEITPSETNARSAIPQPATTSKHKPSGLPEPPTKRKTLAERAGEPTRSNLPTTNTATNLFGNAKISNATSYRNPSGYSTTSSSSRATSGHPRAVSNLSSSVSSKASHINANGRPQSALSYSRNGQPLPQRQDSYHDFTLSMSENEPGKRQALDTDSRLKDVEEMIRTMKEQMHTSDSEKSSLEEKINIYKMRITELEAIRSQMSSSTGTLQSQVDTLKSELSSCRFELENSRRNHSNEVDDLTRRHRNELEDLRDQQRRGEDRSRRTAEDEAVETARRHRQQLDELEERLKGEIAQEKQLRQTEMQSVKTQSALEKQNLEIEASNRERDQQTLRQQIELERTNLETEKALTAGLKQKLAEAAVQATERDSKLDAMKAKIDFLESDSHAQGQAFADIHNRMQEAIDERSVAMDKLQAEEALIRKLRNQIQELKGNIRVFCRVRPALGVNEEDTAKISFPDTEDEGKEIIVMGPETKSALGNISSAKNNFAFDKVFSPAAQNLEIFDEISQLVQSALDGYNVCIFCYGQTGSGKTHTMSSSDGMIPLATDQIYATAKQLQEKGWSYTMEGSFVEVYNENLNDLLGNAEDLDKKKLQIVHDKDKCRTTITDVTTVMLDSPDTVANLLERAASNRSVAATKANERSSRSHSVFILKLIGENKATGERSEGTLNLVDLAGSERLAHSQAVGDRLKETQNINKSLSSLGDVIGALGSGKSGAHIPYRNSKLTYLLQHSLGGNSKTLMFVMISPMMAHLSETLTSLKFATKVHNTHIGTAKRQVKAAS